MSTETYSPKNMIMTVNGVQLTGFGDTDMVTISLDEAKFTKYVSVDGQVARSHNVADTGRFVFTLNQTSAANQVLSGLLALDTAEASGNNVFSVAVRDQNSDGTFYLGTDCWIEGMPESSFGKEIGTREWVIEARKIRYSIAGSAAGLLQGVVEGFRN